jgi:hypothetical protein
MRRAYLIAAAVAGALALAPSAAGAAQCRPSHSHTIASNRVARVYELYDRHDGANYVWGCLFAGRRSFIIGENNPRRYDSFEWMPRALLRGRFVAVVQQLRYRSESTCSVRVFDLRSRRPVHAWTRSGGGYGVWQDWSAPSLVLERDGDVAWIAANIIESHPPYYWVYKATTTRQAVELDSGDVAPHSLALHGRLLSWRRGGETHTAPLR